MPEDQVPPQLQDLGSLLFPEQNKPQLSFSQRLVGINFNPSNDSVVDKAKKLCQELTELVVNNEVEGVQPDYLYNLIKGKALGEILSAQMHVVKLLTLKY